MRWWKRSWTVGFVGVLACSGAQAQEGQPVVPGDGRLDTSRLAEFDAIYDQMGFEMRVRFRREPDDAGWSFSMEMANPTGTAIDHIGHGPDLDFRYRRFAFGAYRDEFLDVRATGDSIVLGRLPRDDESAVPRRASEAVSEPVLDGTFMYWALGLLDEDGPTSFRVWGPTSESLEIRETASLRRVDDSDVELPDGSMVTARVFEAVTGSGRLRMIVSREAPYLIRQELVSEDGSVTPIIELGGLGPVGGAR